MQSNVTAGIRLQDYCLKVLHIPVVVAVADLIVVGFRAVFIPGAKYFLLILVGFPTKRNMRRGGGAARLLVVFFGAFV